MTNFKIGCGPESSTCISGTIGPVDWGSLLSIFAFSVVLAVAIGVGFMLWAIYR